MKRLNALLVAAALLSGGCGKSSSDALGPRLFVFDCGMLRFESIEYFSIANDETEVRDLIVPCYVIKHKGKHLLWDGGLPSKTAEADGWQGEGTHTAAWDGRDATGKPVAAGAYLVRLESGGVVSTGKAMLVK